MTVPNPADDPAADEPQVDARPEPERPVVDKAMLDRVFGTVLPDTTRDERDPGGSSGSEDDWDRRNLPPHHG